jgi:dTDP-L-rhamnose 4-epimerase
VEALEVRALVTGGAGFIGSHIADALLSAGHQVRVLDSLDPQVHGGVDTAPSYLSTDVEFVRGDVRDADLLRHVLRDVNVVYHQAAAVGVAQSMYEVRRYIDANCVGTANLLEVILSARANIDLLVVASSMSIYGEGEYACPTCGPSYPELRRVNRLAQSDWEHTCPMCTRTLAPRPTRESKPLRPRSPYAVSKRDQEELCLSVGEAYRLPTIALRYFNVYGPRQALSNPYTGLAAIFSSRILNDRSPVIFEDGMQSRDFVHVSDVARANVLALSAPNAVYQSINIGTGRRATVRQVADVLAGVLNSKAEPTISGRYRAGDIRHCIADVTRARTRLGFTATVELEHGFADLASWLAGQQPDDRLEQAVRELEVRGLATAEAADKTAAARLHPSDVEVPSPPSGTRWAN